MLVVLTLGHMIPLVLNIEALFFSKQNRQSFQRASGGLLEMNEVIVRAVTMVAFLLKVRLLQLVLSARAHYYNDDFDWSYMYANPAADYYSTACDVIIPLGGLLSAAIIYLQQRNGGRCFLPKRFKELKVYEKVPVTSEP
ncbi:hypothetical protein GH714_041647 [Hevea brasiliensis]|uniref:RING-type E3 ubiquitin transferase n=1 Tax=Hevea brasiliensis TaxID=3981 RepID=A0A6A6MVH9_HEVBR|nr:hypothetical protein GH714_041647 [Hevea brasiliensis]